MLLIRFIGQAGYGSIPVFLWLLLYVIPSSAQKQPDISYRATDLRGFNTLETDTAYIGRLIRRGTEISEKHPDSGSRLYEEALEKSRAAGFDKGIVKSLNNLGVYYFGKKDFNRSIEHFTEALRHSGPKDADTVKASIYYNLGLCYSRKGLYDQSIAFFNEALARCRHAGAGKNLLLRIYSELGVCHQYKGAYDIAAYYYYKILGGTPDPDQGNYVYTLDAYNRLGVLLFQLRLFDQAHFYFDRGERLARADIPGPLAKRGPPARYAESKATC